MKALRVQNGVEYDCLAINTDHFEMGHQESQKMQPWEGSNKYGRWTMWFALATIGLFTILRILNAIGDRQYKRGKRFVLPLKAKLAGLCRWVGYRDLAVVSKYTIFPSNVGILAYFTAAFLFTLCICFIPKFWYRTCRKFGSPPLAVRAGLMANAMTPLIYGFAGKINIITVLTGCSYEKLNVFHQLTGWLCLFFSWVHTVPFLTQPVWEGGMQWLAFFYSGDVYYPSGIVALVFIMVLTFFSVKTIRNRYYELFLHLHWPIAIAYLGVLFWHDANALESWPYLWSTLGVYGAGLLYRYFKKTNYMQLRQDWFTTDAAVVETLPDAAVQINIFTRTIKKWSPGSHIFVRFTNVQPLGNHPFTIASVPEYDEASGFAQMRLIARPYSGFTKRLYDQACQKPETEFSVMWDGPYGAPQRDVEAFDHVLLVGSGAGATAMVPFLKHLAKQLNKGVVLKTQTIQLLWVVRHADAFTWFQDDIVQALGMLPNPDIAKVVVHVTGSQVDEKLGGEKGIEFKQGRPDISQMFQQRSQSLNGRTMIVTSGCASVRHDVANAAASLQSLVLKGQAEEVYLHTETFGW